MTGSRDVARGVYANVTNAVALTFTVGLLVFMWFGVENPMQRWLFWADLVGVALAVREFVWTLRTPLLSMTPSGLVWRRQHRDVREVEFARVASWERYPDRLRLTDVEGKSVEIELEDLPSGERTSATSDLEALLRAQGKEAERYYPGH